MYFQHQCKVAPRQRIACVLISWGNFIITHKLKLRRSVTSKKYLRLTQSFTTSSAACISIIMTRIDIAMPNSTTPHVLRSTLPTELMFWKGYPGSRNADVLTWVLVVFFCFQLCYCWSCLFENNWTMESCDVVTKVSVVIITNSDPVMRTDSTSSALNYLL